MNSTKENRYCIYSKRVFILENNMYFEEQQLIHRKGFISLAISATSITVSTAH